MSASAVAARVQERLLDGGGELGAIDAQRVAAVARREAALLDGPSLERLVDDVVAEVIGLGPLEPLLRDPTVTEVMVNGPGPVWIERSGTVRPAGLSVDQSDIERIVERVVAPLGLRADRTAPIVDARLGDGSRVHIVLPPLAVDGPCVTIRRFGAVSVPLGSFTTADVARLLSDAVGERRNIVISGGTASGKTTLLNALAGRVPAIERVITIEDTAELSLPSAHVVRLEARPPNTEGAGAATMRDLVRAALRMRPDRIVVGECRGGEALDMLQAMNTGHEGSLTTCHANTPVDAVRRLETMVLGAGMALPLTAIREQLAASVDLVVQVQRDAGGGRRIVAVAELPSVPPPAGEPWLLTTVATAAGIERLPSRPPRRADSATAGVEEAAC